MICVNICHVRELVFCSSAPLFNIESVSTLDKTHDVISTVFDAYKDFQTFPQSVFSGIWHSSKNYFPKVIPRIVLKMDFITPPKCPNLNTMTKVACTYG
jgi:hypothetical protein